MVERTYSVTPVRQSVRVQDGVRNLRLGVSGVSFSDVCGEGGGGGGEGAVCVCVCVCV